MAPGFDTSGEAPLYSTTMRHRPVVNTDYSPGWRYVQKHNRRDYHNDLWSLAFDSPQDNFE